MAKNLFDMFIFFCLSLWSLSGVFGDEVKSLSVMEGDSVTLNPNDADIMGENLIMWTFGHNSLIVKINRNDNDRQFPDERFRDRLKLDQTGSLSITDTRTTDSGLYQVLGTSKDTPLSIFNITVYAHLPVPVISNSSSGSSVSKCAFLCSVVNVSDVTLSWYKGNSLLSSMSVSDLSRSLSLHLESLDDSYSCVVNNPIRNQTTHLNSEHCQPCSDDCVCCCGFTEATIRLALSALVGVAAVAVLVYDIRSRSLQQKREQTSPSNSD